MGKKDKKSQSSKENQRRHNKLTRGVNTNKQGVLWAIRQKKIGDRIVNEEIRVPVKTGWNPDLMAKATKEAGLPEPFDALHLDWANELREYTEEINSEEGVKAKVERTSLPNGNYEYQLIKTFDFDKDIYEIVLRVESPHNLNFGPTGKFQKKGR